MNTYLGRVCKHRNVRNSPSLRQSVDKGFHWTFIIIAFITSFALCLSKPSTLKDHYKVLDLSRDCDEVQIKKAYHRLSLKFHPDKNKSPSSTEMFIRIREAYEVLRDPKRRAVYDAAIRFDEQRRGGGTTQGQKTKGTSGSANKGSSKSGNEGGEGGRRSGSKASGDHHEQSTGGKTQDGREENEDRRQGGADQRDFVFMWDGKPMRFEQVIEMIRVWESQNSELGVARAAFDAFLRGVSEAQVQAVLERVALADSPQDGFAQRMFKRLAKWMVVRIFRWVRSLLVDVTREL